jgi:hypothetical protein
VTEFLNDAIADGRIRYAGFSFHDTVDLFREIVDTYDWTFARIHYNHMDGEYQAGTEGLFYAAWQGSVPCSANLFFFSLNDTQITQLDFRSVLLLLGSIGLSSA